MHGILTELEGDELRMVATDGRRLVLATAPVEEHASGIKRAIVPTKGMQLFCKVIDDPTEVVRIHFGENQFGLKTAKAEVYARLIDGEFPRYSAVIPASTQNTVEADAHALHQKLKLVANVTSADTRAVQAVDPERAPDDPRPLGAHGRGQRGARHPLRGQADRHRLQPRLPDRRAEELRAAQRALRVQREEQPRQVHARGELHVRRDADHHRHLTRNDEPTETRPSIGEEAPDRTPAHRRRHPSLPEGRGPAADERRRARPARLGEAAGPAWRTRATPVAFQGGQLTVEVGTPLALAELKGFHGEGLRTKANAALGEQRIRKVVIKLKS
jgi:hypothetical protein